MDIFVPFKLYSVLDKASFSSEKMNRSILDQYGWQPTRGVRLKKKIPSKAKSLVFVVNYIDHAIRRAMT